MNCKVLVFSDLDGSLLDHDSYSYAPALPMLTELEKTGTPVICCTSKTRRELLDFRSEIKNSHPFIAENGAAIFIPKDYFQDPPEDCEIQGDYRVRAFCKPRQYWQEIINRKREAFPDAFLSFADAGVERIAEMTGLSMEQANAASQREYGEPLKWLADEQTLNKFIATMKKEGANVLVGGRFVHVSGAIDKGRALTWLVSQYQAQTFEKCISIAAGDSGNDIAMLEAADFALVIRSPAHDFPQLKRIDGVVYSKEYGPQGWAEGIGQLLAEIHQDKL